MFCITYSYSVASLPVSTGGGTTIRTTDKSLNYFKNYWYMNNKQHFDSLGPAR